MALSHSSDGSSWSMGDATDQEKWHAKIAKDWLLAILRYAVTLHQDDRSSVLAIAEELDHLGFGTGVRSEFLFFRTRSIELCNAITDNRNSKSTEMLRLHLNRIDDPRLKRAFKAAIAFEDIPRGQETNANVRKSSRANLWKGLRS